MSTDRNMELFSSIKKSIDELNAKTEPKILSDIMAYLELLSESAEKGFGIPEIEQQYLDLLTNLHDSFGKVRMDIEELKSASRQNGNNIKVEPPVLSTNETKKSDDNDKNAEPLASIKRSRGKQGDYSEEDKIFIADPKNSIEALMERYGYDKPTAHKMRSYFKKCIGGVKKSDTVKEKTIEPKVEKGVHRKYTEEDKQFILDENNSIADLVERFGYKDKQAAYKARAYIKRIS